MLSIFMKLIKFYVHYLLNNQWEWSKIFSRNFVLDKICNWTVCFLQNLVCAKKIILEVRFVRSALFIKYFHKIQALIRSSAIIHVYILVINLSWFFFGNIIVMFLLHLLCFIVFFWLKHSMRSNKMDILHGRTLTTAFLINEDFIIIFVCCYAFEICLQDLEHHATILDDIFTDLEYFTYEIYFISKFFVSLGNSLVRPVNIIIF